MPQLATLVSELQQREEEGLSLYRPTEEQMPFHLSQAQQKLLRGGNRCLGWMQPVYDPVDGTTIPVCERTQPFHVLSVNPDTGRQEIRRTGVPFLKGTADLYRIHLGNGESFVATQGHVVLTSEGWRSVSSVLEPSLVLPLSSSDACLTAFPRDVRESVPSISAPISTSVASTGHLENGRFYDFEVEGNHNYVLAGVVHHNSGKTTATAAEVASAATGIPLRDSNGIPIEHQYPVDRPLLIWIIGIDENHLGRIYRKLFGDGVFRVIRDAKTGKLRAWRPWNKGDYARRTETVPSPPFIPKRMVEDVAWLKKGKKIPSLVVLKNGTHMYFFPSGGVPGMGDPVDLVYIDEDIQYPEYVPEWIGRLPDAGKGTTPSGKWVEGGRLLWSAWPHDHNDALQTMTRMAAEEVGKADPICHETVLWFSKNKFISARQKARTIQAWSAFGAAVVAARDRGEYMTDSVKWFPNFYITVQGVPRQDGPDALERALAENGGEVPNDWTHYFSIDPGHTHNVGVFVAIPPPKIGDFFYVWREIYLEGGSADFMAQEVKRLAWAICFEAFLLDDHAGRRSYEGMGGYKIRDHYSDAFEKVNLKSRVTGTRFLSGSDDITARNLLLKSWMEPREDGTTKFRINSIYCPQTVREFSLYKKKITRDEVQDKEVARWNHAMAAITYLASRHPVWIPPEVYLPAKVSPMDSLIQRMPYFSRETKTTGDVFFGAGTPRGPAA